jgi:uncharacterized membrane protein
MPFCTQCGGPVETGDAFCAQCGSPQGERAGSADAPKRAPGTPKANQEFLSGMSPRTASLLGYIPFIGWIGSIVILASDRFRQNKDVRFHAFQGLYLYAAYFLGGWVLREFLDYDGVRKLRNIYELVIVAIQVFMLVKTNQDEKFALPFLGDLADRSVSEQK